MIGASRKPIGLRDGALVLRRMGQQYLRAAQNGRSTGYRKGDLDKAGLRWTITGVG